MYLGTALYIAGMALLSQATMDRTRYLRDELGDYEGYGDNEGYEDYGDYDDYDDSDDEWVSILRWTIHDIFVHIHTGSRPRSHI